MTRDPAVLALYALHLTPVEYDFVAVGLSIRRPVWPPKTCEGAVVGLCVGGLVLGEARLWQVTCDEFSARWHFGPATLYAQPLSHPASVGSHATASPMPPAPLGTLTPARHERDEW